jgi:phage FluMu protein Com
MDKFIYCPICNNKTRQTIREDTEAKNLPVYCPKCKNVTYMDVKDGKTTYAGVK